jgi:hypothetical protein
MPVGLRLKGQECQIRITQNGVLMSTLTAIRSFSAIAELAQLTEEYLGETAQRVDDIFNKVKGTAEFHVEDASAFDFVTNVVRRSQRRTAAGSFKVNIHALVTFPDGRQKRIQIFDVAFGELPFGFPTRKDYVTFRVDFISGQALTFADA